MSSHWSGTTLLPPGRTRTSHRSASIPSASRSHMQVRSALWTGWINDSKDGLKRDVIWAAPEFFCSIRFQMSIFVLISSCFGRHPFFTARQQSCEKVMFTYVFLRHSLHSHHYPWCTALPQTHGTHPAPALPPCWRHLVAITIDLFKLHFRTFPPPLGWHLVAVEAGMVGISPHPNAVLFPMFFDENLRCLGNQNWLYII